MRVTETDRESVGDRGGVRGEGCNFQLKKCVNYKAATVCWKLPIVVAQFDAGGGGGMVLLDGCAGWLAVVGLMGSSLAAGPLVCLATFDCTERIVKSIKQTKEKDSDGEKQTKMSVKEGGQWVKLNSESKRLRQGTTDINTK